jgi:hypothetical protein
MRPLLLARHLMVWRVLLTPLPTIRGCVAFKSHYSFYTNSREWGMYLLFRYFHQRYESVFLTFPLLTPLKAVKNKFLAMISPPSQKIF